MLYYAVIKSVRFIVVCGLVTVGVGFWNIDTRNSEDTPKTVIEDWGQLALEKDREEKPASKKPDTEEHNPTIVEDWGHPTTDNSKNNETVKDKIFPKNKVVQMTVKGKEALPTARCVQWEQQGKDGLFKLTGVRELDTRKCLKKQKLLFVGDSVLRYTYLGMLRMLEGKVDRDEVSKETNDFLVNSKGFVASPDPLVRYHERRTDVKNDTSLLWQKEWRDWSSFVNGTTSAFDGRMCCDCYRTPYPYVNKMKSEKGSTIKERNVKHWASQRENRFYSNTELAVEADFFFMHGDHGSHGELRSHSSNCSEYLQNPNISHSWTGLAPELSKHLTPGYTTIIANAGLWYPNYVGEPTKAIAMLKALESLGVGGSTRLIWISTTHTCNKGSSHREGAMLDHLMSRDANWHFLDLYNITHDLVLNKLQVPERYAYGKSVKLHTWLRIKCSQAYVDSVGHFQPYYYKEFGKALLDLAC